MLHAMARCHTIAAMVRTGRWLLDLFFPPRCPGCWAICHGRGFCSSCQERVTYIRPPLCPICGVSFVGVGPDHLCSSCRGGPPHFDRARACAAYESGSGGAGAIAAALQRYKYAPEITLSPFLGELLANLCPYPDAHDLIVPVPLHARRLRQRGFNQSLLLARPLARRRRTRIDPFLLVRNRDTSSQVGLCEAERQRNITGAFSVRDETAVRDRHVLLIDDVFTTGATANECAKTLRRAGARRVDVLVLLRVGADSR